MPELKRQITVKDEHLQIRTGKDRQLPFMLVKVDFPARCSKYEVRYRQSPNGEYRAMNATSRGLCIYVASRSPSQERYLQLCCFLPQTWRGKRFNRYVKVITK